MADDAHRAHATVIHYRQTDGRPWCDYVICCRCGWRHQVSAIRTPTIVDIIDLEIQGKLDRHHPGAGASVAIVHDRTAAG